MQSTLMDFHAHFSLSEHYATIDLRHPMDVWSVLNRERMPPHVAFNSVQVRLL